MKKILLVITFILGASLVSYAHAEGPVFDPIVTPERILNCTTPIEYNNNDPIPIGDIAEIRLYRSTDGVTWGTSIASSNTCHFVEPINTMSEGQYYYEVTAVSNRYGTESTRSNRVAMEVRITRIPKPPSNLSWE